MLRASFAGSRTRTPHTHTENTQARLNMIVIVIVIVIVIIIIIILQEFSLNFCMFRQVFIFRLFCTLASRTVFCVFDVYR